MTGRVSIPRRWLWGCYALSLVLIGLDQWTKQLAVAHLQYGLPLQVTPWLDWLLLYNPGVAFSMFSEGSGWQRWVFSGLSAVVSVVLVIWLARLSARERLLAVALACILGGAVGNLIDRASLGYVVDFISVHYQQYRWPAFNIADSAVSIGAVLLVLDMFVGSQARQDD